MLTQIFIVYTLVHSNTQFTKKFQHIAFYQYFNLCAAIWYSTFINKMNAVFLNYKEFNMTNTNIFQVLAYNQIGNISRRIRYGYEI